MRIHRFLVLLTISLFFGFLSESRAQTPWVKGFVPARTLYIAPQEAGNGKGGDAANAKSFSDAIQSARAGDLNLMLPGLYRGKFTLKREGSNGKPIVWKASPGAHVQIVGAIEVVAEQNWVWGLDISDPNNSERVDSGLRLWAPYGVAINNVIHDVQGKNGIGAWEKGMGQIIYGNILYRTRGIYTQNNYEKDGYKYFVANLIGDAGDPTSPGSTYNFHGYTVKGYLSGFYIKDNIFWNGKFLIGGRNLPEQNNIVRENYFYKKEVIVGFRRPAQIEFINNYLAHSILNANWLWGKGEVQYENKKPTVFQGNEIAAPSGGTTIHLRTSAYTSTGRQEGVPAIRSSDEWDNNTYTEPFSASVHAGGQQTSVKGLPGWRMATQVAGNQFDANSQLIPPPTISKIVVFQNQYDTARLHVAVFNWANENSVTLSSDLIPQNASYGVYSLTNLFGEPIVSGTYQGSIRIPISTEFQAFIIKLR